MNIVVFGASGPTGLHLVEQGLSIGHKVTAFVRDPKSIPFQHENLINLQGNAFDQEAVELALSWAGCCLLLLRCTNGLKRTGLYRRHQKHLTCHA